MTEGQQRAFAVVDGANVAYEAAGDRPKVSHLLAMREELKEEGDSMIIVDASLRHEFGASHCCTWSGSS